MSYDEQSVLVRIFRDSLELCPVSIREFNSEVRHSPTQPEPVLERPLQAA